MPVRITTSRNKNTGTLVDLEVDDTNTLSINLTTLSGVMINKILIGPHSNHTLDVLQENLERLRTFVRD